MDASVVIAERDEVLGFLSRSMISRTRAISGSQPYAIHTARFYCESAALPCYGRTFHSERFQTTCEPYRDLALATTSGGGFSTEPAGQAAIDRPSGPELRSARPANQRDSLARTPRRGITVRQGGFSMMAPRCRAPSTRRGQSHAVNRCQSIGRRIPASRTHSSWGTLTLDATAQ